MTVVESPDGLRLRGGLVALTAETIRPGRVQAVRMIEPLLWRPFGWCRLEVDVAGRQKREGEGAVEGKRLRAVLPVGSRALALDLVARILPGTPTERLRPPRRARWKSPLRYRNLVVGPQRRLRRDDERPHQARDRVGAARRRCRACAASRARCSGGCGSRRSTSTRRAATSTRACATATAPRRTGRSRS